MLLDQLPYDMIREILKKLNDNDLFQISFVNKKLYDISSSIPLKYVYRNTDLKRLPSRFQVKKVQINHPIYSDLFDINNLPLDLIYLVISYSFSTNKEFDASVRDLLEKSINLRKLHTFMNIENLCSLLKKSSQTLHELSIENGDITQLTDIALFKNLKVLSLPRSFNSPIEPFKMLYCLEDLTFNVNFNQSLEPLRNLSLKYLTLGFSFAKTLEPISDMKSLKTLVYHPTIEKDLDFIPETIEKLNFLSRWSFSFKYLKKWRNLLSLNFYGFIDENLTDNIGPYLPSTLLYLKLGKNYKGSFDFASDSSHLTKLKTLYFSDMSSHLISNFSCLKSLEKVKVPSLSFFSNTSTFDSVSNTSALNFVSLTSSFTREITRENIENIKNILSLSLGKLYNQPITFFQYFTNLRELHLSNEFNHPIDVLIYLPQLRILELKDNFNQPIDAISNLINLRELILGYKFNQPINALESIKYTLEILSLGSSFSQNIEILYSLYKLEWLELNQSTIFVDENRLIKNVKNLCYARVNKNILIY